MSKIAFYFPGPGAQICGMGQDFYEQAETAKEILTRHPKYSGSPCRNSVLRRMTDWISLSTHSSRPWLRASIAMMKVFMERTGITPSVAAGLSLGEYPAMAAAGVMSAEDAIRTVGQRGILMQEAVPAGVGAMSAVLAMDGEKIEEVIAPIDGVQIANYNCPGQIVISGKKRRSMRLP